VGDDPFVIEYNCRMGDPETEVVIPRIKNDLVDILAATARGQLQNKNIEVDERFAATIVAVSGGYPNDYEKGFKISGLDTIMENAHLFHMGTKEENNQVVTNGGRVLCATVLGQTLEEAINGSRDLVEALEFEGMYFRRDIGFEFLSSETDGEGEE
jgi:phosphoribosylamine--glycine ligase